MRLVAFLRAHVPGFEQSWITLTSPILGVRATRQILGGIDVFNQQRITLGRLLDAARGGDGWIHLAQVIPDTAPAEATTGNPSLAPLKWVGLLAIPDPTDKDPRAIVECTIAA